MLTKLFLTLLLLTTASYAQDVNTTQETNTSVTPKRITFWQVQKVFSWDGLNIRNNADYTSKKVGQIPFDASCIVNHGCGKDIDFVAMGNMEEDEIKAFLGQSKEEWCYIDYDGISGWAHSYYLTESKAQCK